MIEVRIRPLRGTTLRTHRQLRRMQRRVKDKRTLYRQLSVYLSRWVNENFKTEGGKVGNWAPFKYGGRVLPNGQIDTSAKLLQDTGKMRASFLPFTERRILRSVVGIGSALDRSLYHDQGTVHLPARRLLPNETDRDVERAVINIYDWHVRRAVDA